MLTPGPWCPQGSRPFPGPPNPCEALTQPELPGDVPKTMGIVLPVPPEVCVSIHAALEHLGSRGHRQPVAPGAAARPCTDPGVPAAPTSQPPPSVSMSQNTFSGRSRLPLRKMVVVLEVPAPFCISSPQSRGKGTRSPPGRAERGQSVSQTEDPCCPLSPDLGPSTQVPVVKEVDMGGVRLSPHIARSQAL